MHVQQLEMSVMGPRGGRARGRGSGRGRGRGKTMVVCAQTLPDVELEIYT